MGHDMTGMKTIFSALGILAALAMTPAQAADYPDKPITIVVPFPAGSSSDMIPRLLGPLLTKSLGVPIVVENRPGANGSIGAARVASAAPDGYTLLMATTGVLAINQWIYAKPLYAPERDFAPVDKRRRDAEHDRGQSFGKGLDADRAGLAGKDSARIR